MGSEGFDLFNDEEFEASEATDIGGRDEERELGGSQEVVVEGDHAGKESQQRIEAKIERRTIAGPKGKDEEVEDGSQQETADDGPKDSDRVSHLLVEVMSVTDHKAGYVGGCNSTLIRCSHMGNQSEAV